LISVFIGMKPATIAPGVTATGKARAAIVSAACWRSAAGRPSRRASAWRRSSALVAAEKE
jgi:hypothetical protein